MTYFFSSKTAVVNKRIYNTTILILRISAFFTIHSLASHIYKKIIIRVRVIAVYLRIRKYWRIVFWVYLNYELNGWYFYQSIASNQQFFFSSKFHIAFSHSFKDIYRVFNIIFPLRVLSHTHEIRTYDFWLSTRRRRTRIRF